ncbi:unnamed protein product [Paramecium sonneborni]|uniref:Transmembrane protein n=1 Tax=Paramecium sonneborni TaxID=65129 RepID=A0A8S1Q1I5_9CILI|nr:unnamed protein product [Paramecium sonneborni]
MIINIILINAILYQTRSIILQGDECTCEDYTIQQCNDYANCQVNGFNCGELICQNRNYEQCQGNITDYKCVWDELIQACIDYNHKCEEIPETDCTYNQQKQQNCLYDLDNQLCKDLSCKLISHSSCPPNLCFKDASSCSDPIKNFDCSTLSTSKCDFVYTGTGQVCHLNNSGICKSYNLYKLQFSCRDWSDSKNGCKKISNCKFDQTQKVCRDPKCFEIIQFYQLKLFIHLNQTSLKDKDTCNSPIKRNDQSKSVELCKWNVDYCQELGSSDLSKLSESQCTEKSANKYIWNQMHVKDAKMQQLLKILVIIVVVREQPNEMNLNLLILLQQIHSNYQTLVNNLAIFILIQQKYVVNVLRQKILMIFNQRILSQNVN